MFHASTQKYLALAALLTGWSAAHASKVTVADWGTAPGGQPVHLYHLHQGKSEAVFSDYGARIVSIQVPDAHGKVSDVVLGSDQVTGYTNQARGVMGATVGRYANRIAGASITLDGANYDLSKNLGPNTIHGGVESFYTRVWKGTPIKDGVRMTLDSPDGDMGFPGALHVQVTFHMSVSHGRTTVAIDYSATTTKPTVINLTNHSYFNLSDPSMSVNNDIATIAASHYTPAANGGIPTGEIATVAGTPFDFRTPRTFAQTMPPRGYDNNMVLDHPGLNTLAAEVHDSNSGRVVRVYTTEPGVQLYVPQPPPASATNPARPANPARVPTLAFCLETQHFPDSPHHPNFPTTELRPGHTFSATTKYVFSTQ